MTGLRTEPQFGERFNAAITCATNDQSRVQARFEMTTKICLG